MGGKLEIESLRRFESLKLQALENGDGYGTEAVAWLIELAKSLGMEKVTAMTHHDNAASSHLLKKLGFQREAIGWFLYENGEGLSDDCVDTYAYMVNATKSKTLPDAASRQPAPVQPLKFDMRGYARYVEENVAVHNFASATNPGGGVTRGSRAQEECLCRCSTLYPVLNTEALRRGYYDYHRLQRNVLYTDACIYTPGIRIIKTDTDLPQRLPQPLWETVDVLTCAAPNLRPVPYNRMNPGQGDAVEISDAELLQLHKKRASHLLTIAAANDVNALVLGAFGCGAFENDPRIVAKAYAAVLAEYRHYFDEIRFAVYCSPRDRSNYEAFAEVLGEKKRSKNVNEHF